MPENKLNVFETFTKLTPKLRKEAMQETREITLKQIAKAEVMHRFYREKALTVEDPKEAGKYNLQADKIEEAQKINFEWMEWAEKQI